MIEAALIALALAVVGFAGAAMALALRVGGLRGELAQAQLTSAAATKQLSMTASEFADYKRRTDAQLDAARADVQELEHDLEACTTPGAQRARLAQLLGKLSPRAADPGTKRTGPLPADPAAGGATDPHGGA